eukprot:gene8410-9891_t
MAGFDMIFMLGAVFMVNKVDFKEPNNVTYALIAFGIIQGLCILTYGYIYKCIMARPVNNTSIEIKTPATMMAPEKVEKMTVSEYDVSQIKKILGQSVMSIGIPLFLFYKWGLVPPLAMNCVFGPQNLYKNKLFKIYVLGESEEVHKRPFIEENPMAALFGQQPAEESTTPQPIDNSGNIRIPSENTTTSTATTVNRKKKASIVEVSDSEEEEVPAPKSPEVTKRTRKID